MSQVVLTAALRWIVPIAIVFALTILRNFPANVGAGFVAGVVLALPLALCALVFGVLSVFRALPPTFLKLTVAIGAAVSVLGVAAPELQYAPQVAEAGVFVATGAGLLLALLVLMARAPALPDARPR
jgi:hypothetical protein